MDPRRADRARGEGRRAGDPAAGDADGAESVRGEVGVG